MRTGRMIASIAPLCLLALTCPAWSAETDQEEPILAKQITRGPIHEAFARPLPQSGPRRAILKTPPPPALEPIPLFQPQGDPIWIPGYWFFDEETQSFLWVGGVWRYPPQGREWVPGFWKTVNGASTWYPGFWAITSVPDQVLPPPPPSRDPAVPAVPPHKDRIAYPGHWLWSGGQYFWQPGTFTKISPGYLWIPPHHVPMPGGSRLIPGYWDYDLSQRGLATCPSRPPVHAFKAKSTASVAIEPVWYLRPTTVSQHLFIQPKFDHYLFGDYYSPIVQRIGIESSDEYSRHHLDPIFSLQRAKHRDEPNWEAVRTRQLTELRSGWVPRPPREPSMAPNGEIAWESLAAPPELVLAEIGLEGRFLNQAHAQRVLNQTGQYLAMVRERAARDEIKPVKMGPGGIAPAPSDFGFAAKYTNYAADGFARPPVSAYANQMPGLEQAGKRSAFQPHKPGPFVISEDGSGIIGKGGFPAQKRDSANPPKPAGDSSKSNPIQPGASSPRR